MKATVYWKDWMTGKRYQKTFVVEQNEPNHILNIARKNCYLGADDYVTNIKCGRYIFEWNGKPNW